MREVVETHNPVELAAQRIRDWSHDLTVAADSATTIDEALRIAGCAGELIHDFTQIQNLALTQADRLPSQ